VIEGEGEDESGEGTDMDKSIMDVIPYPALVLEIEVVRRRLHFLPSCGKLKTERMPYRTEQK
jgi:hypothetical protein